MFDITLICKFQFQRWVIDTDSVRSKEKMYKLLMNVFTTSITICFSSFAASICNKLSDMIQDIATPVELKLQLIPILQHMYHDVQTSSKVTTRSSSSD